MTRKQTAFLALFAALALCLSSGSLAAGSSFRDVPKDKWYAPWVERACALGFVQGVGENRYYPSGQVSFCQFTLMLDQALFPDDVAAQPSGEIGRAHV